MKHIGWVNITRIEATDIDNNPFPVYRTGNIIYKDRKTALKHAKDYDVATVKVKWEEKEE